MHFQNNTFKHKIKTANHAKSYVRKSLRKRNYRRKFIRNLLPEKRKENMYIKQPRFKSRLIKLTCLTAETHCMRKWLK